MGNLRSAHATTRRSIGAYSTSSPPNPTGYCETEHLGCVKIGTVRKAAGGGGQHKAGLADGQAVASPVSTAQQSWNRWR